MMSYPRDVLKCVKRGANSFVYMGDSLSSESMYTPKFLTTAELVILSSPILMESSLTLSSVVGLLQ